MLVPVTCTGSVVVVPCFLSVALGWANASSAISTQPSVSIIFFMFVSFVNAFSAEQTSGVGKDGTRATSRVSHSPLFIGASAVPCSQKARPCPRKFTRRSLELDAMYGSSKRCTHLRKCNQLVTDF